MTNYRLLLVLILLLPLSVFGQFDPLKGTLNGNFQVDAQTYREDTLIGAPAVPEQMMLNAFAAITYVNGNFEAGLRYEAYLNPVAGIDARYKGSGIPYRYFTYRADVLEITVGNFYEQFGSGMVLRTYEERNLGFDNSLDGIRIKSEPVRGLTVKGLIGRQRYFWDKGDGIVRGIDGEIDLATLLGKEGARTRYFLGYSFVSKFQRDLDPIYKLPENVGASAWRVTMIRGRFNLNAEYARKVNDPSSANGLIYKPGEALLIQGSYSRKGLGLFLGLKRIDNMDFRSDRTESGNTLLINFLPALAKQHTYSLLAMYPYATQTTGEMAAQGSLIYTISKDKKLGGKYGTTIAINYSIAHAIDRQPPDDTAAVGTPGTLGYSSDFFKVGERRYFQDLGIEVTRKLSKALKLIVAYENQEYDIETIEGHGTEMVYTNIGIADLTWRYASRKSLRFEAQHLWTHQDNGNWGSGMIEWSSRHWFLAGIDQFNYGNDDADRRIHYYNVTGGYLTGGTRISLGYGKQREGIVCVGGVCRAVPASNGLTLSITSSF